MHRNATGAHAEIRIGWTVHRLVSQRQQSDHRVARLIRKRRLHPRHVHQPPKQLHQRVPLSELPKRVRERRQVHLSDWRAAELAHEEIVRELAEVFARPGKLRVHLRVGGNLERQNLRHKDAGGCELQAHTLRPRAELYHLLLHLHSLLVRVPLQEEARAHLAHGAGHEVVQLGPLRHHARAHLRLAHLALLVHHLFLQHQERRVGHGEILGERLDALLGLVVFLVHVPQGTLQRAAHVARRLQHLFLLLGQNLLLAELVLHPGLGVLHALQLLVRRRQVLPNVLHLLRRLVPQFLGVALGVAQLRVFVLYLIHLTLQLGRRRDTVRLFLLDSLGELGGLHAPLLAAHHALHKRPARLLRRRARVLGHVQELL
mmetsp:Transcript_47822/g.89016  ORF Transcript_47822/g.89016 Transcript_47822/m.89016 type:complete len:373 (-) Transcript_47822:179-1297(-)